MSFLAHIFPLSSKWLKVEGSPGTNIKEKILATAMLEEHQHVIIAGPETEYKTAFAFQLAVSAATKGCKVVHLGTHPFSRLPTPIHGMPSPEPSVMKNVDFLYLEDTADIITYFAGIHTKKKLPSYIIVEDILTYASQYEDRPLEQTLARLLALISDAANWIASHNEVQQCSVLLTAPSRISAIQNVLQQFNYKLALYEGPGKEDKLSRLSFQCNETHISVSFQASKDNIVLNHVLLTKTTVTEPGDGATDDR